MEKLGLGKSEKLAPPEADCEAMVEARNGVLVSVQLAELKNCLLHGRGDGYRTEMEQKTRKRDKKTKRLGYLKANVEKRLPLHCLLVERRIVIPAEQTQQEEAQTAEEALCKGTSNKTGTTRPDIINMDPP